MVGNHRSEKSLPAAGKAPEALPSSLGDYQIHAVLGQGGMGQVYLARQGRLQRNVALKVLPQGAAAPAAVFARFEQEMATVGRLDHPNVVRALDARDIDGMLVLALEYVDGVTLEKIAAHNGPLPVAEACEAVRQAAVGLEYLDQNGMVHRDIKPANLMLRRDGQVKILDLGLALVRGGQKRGIATAVGTPDYISPEQAINGEDVDVRSDIYSLGCTLFRLLAGRCPFGHPDYSSTSEKLTAHACRPLPDIACFRQDVAPGLADVLRKATAKDRNGRYASAAEFAAALESFALGARLADLAADVMGRMHERIELPPDLRTGESISVGDCGVLW